MLDGLMVHPQLRITLCHVKMVLRPIRFNLHCPQPRRQTFNMHFLFVKCYRHITIQHSFFLSTIVHCHPQVVDSLRHPTHLPKSLAVLTMLVTVKYGAGVDSLLEEVGCPSMIFTLVNLLGFLQQLIQFFFGHFAFLRGGKGISGLFFILDLYQLGDGRSDVHFQGGSYIMTHPSGLPIVGRDLVSHFQLFI